MLSLWDSICLTPTMRNKRGLSSRRCCRRNEGAPQLRDLAIPKRLGAPKCDAQEYLRPTLTKNDVANVAAIQVTLAARHDDVTLDAVGGREPWLQAIKTKILKNGWNGGRYVVMSGDEPLMQINTR